MACNCGKKNNQPRRTAVVPRQARIVSAQSTRPAPDQIQALSVTTTDGLNASRRSVERKRREAIFKKLGRM